MTEWFLTITLIYQVGNVKKVSEDIVYGFKTEQACVRYLNIEDARIKRIKSQTNIKRYELNCYGR